MKHEFIIRRNTWNINHLALQTLDKKFIIEVYENNCTVYFDDNIIWSTDKLDDYDVNKIITVSGYDVIGESSVIKVGLSCYMITNPTNNGKTMIKLWDFVLGMYDVIVV